MSSPPCVDSGEAATSRGISPMTAGVNCKLEEPPSADMVTSYYVTSQRPYCSAVTE